ncbi:DUF982 domain-containing protein [Cereibacter changlensis]|uniref:DUF982 domain-containing protein n=1 Tax=Cereibacter changlensis TaxID=402884 RepID=A0A4U0YZZ0_9RHOB|nr:DUF982 domain-containing protein [Cereibacter changlensis]TKA96326.1 DUF982 domain-containing protein [Cereibacter changlensis]
MRNEAGRDILSTLVREPVAAGRKTFRDAPLTVKLPGRKEAVVVSSVFEAAQVLGMRKYLLLDPTVAQAFGLCLAALDGGSEAAARSAFLSASRHAGFTVQGG